jgi:tRNA A37 N6-isopentenylltransferase MiaA
VEKLESVRKEEIKKVEAKKDEAKKEEDPLKNGFNFADKKEKPKKEKAKVKRQRRENRISAYDSSKIERELEKNILVGKPPLAICREIEEKKNYSILTQILSYSDKREIKIKIPV